MKEAANIKERASRGKYSGGGTTEGWEDGNLIINSLALLDFLNDMQKFVCLGSFNGLGT